MTTTQNRSRPRPPLRNRRASSFTEGHGKSGGSGGTGTNTRHRWKYHGGRRSSSGNMNKTVLPSKFLLGGNIRDPLNLNSLADERISKIVNAITPESSPLPTPKHRKAEYKIEVLIPPNITDPLNLNSGVDENEYAATLASNNPVNVRRKKFRYRKRVRSSSHKNAAAAAAAAARAAVAAAQAGSQSEPELALEKRSADDEASAGDDVMTAAAKVAPEPPEFVSPPPAATRRQSASSVPLKRPSTLRGPSPAKKVQKQSEAEIVSPVVPQPGQKKPVRKHHYHHKHRQERRRQQQQQQGRHQQGRQERKDVEKGRQEGEGGGMAPLAKEPQQPSRTKMNAERNRRYEFGNYSRYYGYRNPHHEEDMRLKYLKPDWFRGKEVLDVGCNQGDVTCAIARLFCPKSIVGIDIDKSLIEAARRNVAHVASNPNADSGNGSKQSDYPQCLPAMYGPIDPTGLGHTSSSSSSSKGKGRGKGKGKGKGKNSNRFPQNVKFICGNYVLENDELLETIQPEFDVVVCFSTTKWIHLNFGDEGLKRAFKRMHAQLRPGKFNLIPITRHFSKRFSLCFFRRNAHPGGPGLCFLSKEEETDREDIRELPEHKAQA